MTYRILVTGSRTWTDYGQIRDALHGAFGRGTGRGPINGRPALPTLITGACPTGADRIAEDVWLANVGPDHIERFPADWDRYGVMAGSRRNIEMVDTHPDEVLAFLDWCRKPACVLEPHRSHGATHCADYAEQSGIVVRRHYP